MIIFRHKQTIIIKHMNARVTGQKITAITSVKYLGVY